MPVMSPCETAQGTEKEATMIPRCARLLMPWLLMPWLFAAPAAAQTALTEDAAQATRIARDQSGLTGVIAGGVSGTYVRIASDLASVLDDGEKLRVLPILGRGSVQNIADLLFTRGVDVAIVQSDVLAYLRRQASIPNQNSLQYIAKLYEEEVHVLARREIASLADLAGHKVNVDVHGSGTAVTASVLFDRLGVAARLEHAEQPIALDLLKRGDIAAMVFVVGKPATLFATLSAQDGLHFLPIPLAAELVETYLPARLDARDYRGLIRPDTSIDTVAVSAVMATVTSFPGSDRFRRTARFVEALFTRFEEFRRPGRHPKWQEVNLTAQVPGWTRFPEAQTQLNRQLQNAEISLRAAFNVFLQQSGRVPGDMDPVVKEELFKEFVQWQSQKPAAR